MSRTELPVSLTAVEKVRRKLSHINRSPLLSCDCHKRAKALEKRLSGITKTCLCNFDPLKPHFYTVKLGFTGVYISFLISAQTHRLWVLVRNASQRRFQRVPTIYVLSRNMKNIIVLSENFQFLEVKFSVYLK